MVSATQTDETKTLLENEEGATAIEYGLIAALIGVAIIGSLTVAGDNTSSTFNTVSDAIGESTA